MPFTDEELEEKCQENPWLKHWGEAFREDPFMETDYEYCFTECETLEELADYFLHGCWAIRQGFTYRNLAFIKQVNGGDEWWTIKKFGDKLVAFESISYRHIIKHKGVDAFKKLIERLLEATEEKCVSLTY